MPEYRIPYSSLQISLDDFSGIFSNTTEAEMLRMELETVIEIGKELIAPWGMVLVFDAVEIGVDSFCVKDMRFECGRKIAGSLRGSDKIGVFVCTIGVEKAMDNIQGQLKEEFSKKGFGMTNRFSPGYCNWLVKEQKKLFSLLPSTPCNIQLSESSLMIPSKSISGIIGIGTSVRFVEHDCSLCGMKNCLYRKKLHNIDC